MAPVLYKIETSPPANSVRMLAQVIGLDLELKDMDFGAKEHKTPEYLKLNPVGTLPTLVDGDFAVTDSHAMLTYLLTKYGGGKFDHLYPSDVRTRALIDQALFFDTGVYFIKIKLVALPTIFEGMTEPTPEVLEEIDVAYGVLEAWLQKRKYIAADHLTIADIALGSTTFAMGSIKKIDAKKFPRTSEWTSRLAQEECFKSIVIPRAALLEQFFISTWESNKQKK